jgi:ABC-type bacteriocin/lantibiotic exporter with double-glycine peptidase domain
MRGNLLKKIKPFLICFFTGTLFVGGGFTAGYFINFLIKEKRATSLTLDYSKLSFTFEQDSAATIEAPTLVDNSQVAATATFSSVPALPAGLTLNISDGSVSGIPTSFQDSIKYEITAEGTGV